MKKLYLFFIALVSVSTIFAQDHGNNNYQKEYYQQSNSSENYHQQKDNYQDRNYSNAGHYYNDRQPFIQQQDNRADIDRTNRDYDQRTSRYSNDRSLNSYDRNRGMANTQRERVVKISSFGKGAVAGAIVGLIAGAIFSH